MKKIAIVLLLAMFLCDAQASSAANKSERLKPKWVTHSLPESKSGTYIFARTYATGSSLASAKQMAFVSLTHKLETERNITINTTLEVRETLSQSITEHRDNTESQSRQEIVMDVVEKGRRLQIVCREVDDYWVYRNGVYEVDVLYTVADKNVYGGSYNDSVVVTAKYPGAGFLSIVPSVAQFYKGDNLKGGLILGGEVLAAGAILLCENNRASYIKKMYEQPKYAKEYNSLADRWETGRNISIGAAAAIYVYNLIDGFVAKGAKRVVVKKQKVQFSAAPYTDSQSVGMSLALKF